MQKTPKEIRNPNFDRLIEQVRIENEVSKIRKSYSDNGITLLSHFAFPTNEFEAKVNDLELELKGGDVKISNVYDHSLLYSLLCEIGKSFDRDKIESYKFSLGELISSSSYPIGKKGLILFFIKNIPELKKESKALNDLLLKKASELYNLNRNVNLVIDIGFACDGLEDKISISDLFTEIEESQLVLTREKLAKSIILLSKFEDLNINPLVDGIEDKMYQEFSSWVSPDLFLAIIESEKLINSNLHSDQLNEILSNLKESNSEWSNRIESIQNEGVFINIPNTVRYPKFSPLEDSLSLIALNLVKRNKVIQLSLEESKEFEVYKSLDVKSIITSRSSVNMFGFFLLIIMIINSSLLLYYYNDFQELLSSFWKAKTNPKSPLKIFLYLSNPLALIAINIWWIILVWIDLISNKTISIVRVLKSYPIYKYIIKFLFKL